jgi:hypothetical protein
MKAIEFKRKGLLYYIHKFGFKRDPNDTCSYKAELIICFCLVLVTIHASVLRAIFFLVPKYRKDKDGWGAKNHLGFFLIMFLSFLVGHTFTEKMAFIPDLINWHLLVDNQQWMKFILLVFPVTFIGTIGIALLLGVIVLTVGILYYTYVGAVWVWNKMLSPVINPTYINDDDEPETQLGVLYQSAKEKWCKRIKWN